MEQCLIWYLISSFKQVRNGIDSGLRDTCLVVMWGTIIEDRKLEAGSPMMRSLQNAGK